MSLTIPVTFVDGQTLTAQQLNSVNSAIQTEVNDIGADVATNTANIATNVTAQNKIGSHAFYAHNAAATQAADFTTVATLEIATEVTDQGAAYSTSTYKFTPDLAGRYLLSAGAYVTGLGSGTATLYITKNTTNYTIGKTANDNSFLSGTIVLYANGSSDEFMVRLVASADTSLTIANAFFAGACIYPA